LKLKPCAKDTKQIKKDLNRTFPKNSFFKEEAEGHHKLEEVLVALAVTY